MRDHLRCAAPSLVTYAALACGFTAIVLTAEGHLGWAGVFILMAYIADALDGFVARKLNAASSFGLQLDSLADVLDFGLAPVFLSYKQLQATTAVPGWLTATLAFPYIMGGAFRLARYNLLAAEKVGKSDQTLGLTISTSGALLTLAVLTSNAYPHMAGFLLLPTMVALPLLMVSHIRFPESHVVFSRWRWNLTALALGGAASFVVTPQAVALGLLMGYVAFGLLRAAYYALA
jgi:CDP-diacylglycerol--serine O-phosphatidyltransferase